MKTKLSKQEILERVGTMAQLAGIRPYVLREGRKNGVSAADLWNGSGLSMTVLSDRASDIYSVTYQGRSLCWLSGVGASGPWFAHNGPFEWDKNFGGGMLATCGLTTAGLPSADAGETLNLHGDIANLPAEEVNCRTFWEGDDYWLEYSSRTYQAKPYAENLCLTRQIRMRMGDNTIYLHDRVENLGFSATPLMLIYHMNFGYPLLDEGAKLYLTYQDRFPTSDLASQTVDQIGRVTPPDNGYRARAYNHTVRADAEGYTAEYNEVPDGFAASAFDAVNIVLDAVAKVGTDTPALREELKTLRDYPGVSGYNMSFNEQKEMVKGIYLFEIQDGQFVRVK